MRAATPALRCFCCKALVETAKPARWRQCWSCGARWRAEYDAQQARFERELVALLQAGPLTGERLGERDWFADAITLRMAATCAGLWFTSAPQSIFQGHSDKRSTGQLHPLADGPALPVALVVLAQSGGPALRRLLATQMGAFAEIVVVLDRVEPLDLPQQRVTVVNRRLDGDFAAQRNAGNAAASAPWVFHLDLDETLPSGGPDMLVRLAFQAQEAGLQTVGFPRQNRVDGRMSALYPDTQYRLMPKGGRFENPVHERPVACADWTRTMIASGLPIVHHLDRARVMERSRAYDALGQSHERHHDNLLLLTPYDI